MRVQCGSQTGGNPVKISDGHSPGTHRWVTLTRLGKAREGRWVYRETLDVLLGHVLL